MNGKNKQTAVEWLVNQLNEIGFHTILIEKTIQQAKQMEKEQIIQAYEYTAIGTSHYGEDYYNETFKTE